MTMIEELKNSFLVYEQGMTLEDAADCYDEMMGGTLYREALQLAKEAQE